MPTFSPSPAAVMPTREWERSHALWTQLSLVLALVPGVGTILAIGATLGLWLMKRDSSRFVDDHGREVMNFQISFLIYSIACIPLYFVLIGVPVILAVYVAAVVGVIRGANAAHRGEVFRYPICLRFIR